MIIINTFLFYEIATLPLVARNDTFHVMATILQSQ